jgi:hypothetical protein
MIKVRVWEVGKDVIAAETIRHGRTFFGVGENEREAVNSIGDQMMRLPLPESLVREYFAGAKLERR